MWRTCMVDLGGERGAGSGVHAQQSCMRGMWWQLHHRGECAGGARRARAGGGSCTRVRVCRWFIASACSCFRTRGTSRRWCCRGRVASSWAPREVTLCSSRPTYAVASLHAPTSLTASPSSRDPTPLLRSGTLRGVPRVRSGYQRHPLRGSSASQWLPAAPSTGFLSFTAPGVTALAAQRPAPCVHKRARGAQCVSACSILHLVPTSSRGTGWETG
jgi:hypothetical protein